MSFLVDTDICSAYIKGSKPVFSRFVQYGGRLSITTLTLGELFTWALRAKASPQRLQDVYDLQKLVAVLDVTPDAARKFGEVRAWQLDHGGAAPDFDSLNAAVALVHSLTLVTHNVQDYGNFPGLSVIDWLAPEN